MRERLGSVIININTSKKEQIIIGGQIYRGKISENRIIDINNIRRRFGPQMDASMLIRRWITGHR